MVVVALDGDRLTIPQRARSIGEGASNCKILFLHQHVFLFNFFLTFYPPLLKSRSSMPHVHFGVNFVLFLFVCVLRSNRKMF